MRLSVRVSHGDFCQRIVHSIDDECEKDLFTIQAFSDDVLCAYSDLEPTVKHGASVPKTLGFTFSNVTMSMNYRRRRRLRLSRKTEISSYLNLTRE